VELYSRLSNPSITYIFSTTSKRRQNNEYLLIKLSVNSSTKHIMEFKWLTIVIVVMTSSKVTSLTMDDFVITSIDVCPRGDLGYDMYTQIDLLQCVTKCEQRPWCNLAVYNR